METQGQQRAEFYNRETQRVRINSSHLLLLLFQIHHKLTSSVISAMMLNSNHTPSPSSSKKTYVANVIIITMLQKHRMFKQMAPNHKTSNRKSFFQSPWLLNWVHNHYTSPPQNKEKHPKRKNTARERKQAFP